MKKLLLAAPPAALLPQTSDASLIGLHPSDDADQLGLYASGNGDQAASEDRGYDRQLPVSSRCGSAAWSTLWGGVAEIEISAHVVDARP